MLSGSCPKISPKLQTAKNRDQHWSRSGTGPDVGATAPMAVERRAGVLGRSAPDDVFSVPCLRQVEAPQGRRVQGQAC